MDMFLQACCPECGEQVLNRPPVNWLVPGEVPDWTHASDGTALCPVVTGDGYGPARPVTYMNGPDVVLVIRGRVATR